MKRNISDLLDDIRVQDVELNDLSPLSSGRIKEITMKKVNNNYRRKSAIGRKLLIAAAIVAMLVFSVFAAQKITGAGDWFRSEKNLSDSQVELVNKLGDTFKPQTYTDQGTTIEAKAAYADEYILYLYLSVTAPEGSVLPDGILYDFCDRNAIDYSDPNGFRPYLLGGNAPYEASYNYMQVKPLTDENPADNHKDFMVVLTALPDSSTRFNDGYTKYLPITGVYQQVLNVDGDEDGFELLASANVTVDITLNYAMDSVDLDVEGLQYGGTVSRTWTHDSECLNGCSDRLTGEMDAVSGLPVHYETYEYYVTAHSLSLTNMSATWESEYESDKEETSFGLAFEIVMKDGTTVKQNYIGGRQHVIENRTVGTCIFDAPIDLENVDYVLIGDPDVGETYKVYLPQN